MAVISYKTLNSNLDESLRKAKVPEKNLAEISESIKEGSKKDTKLVIIIMVVVAVMLGGFLGYSMFNNADMQAAMLQWIIGYVVLIGVLFLLVYFANVGLLKLQFNSAIKEGYPELYKQYKV